jgi:hypothetical protein
MSDYDTLHRCLSSAVHLTRELVYSLRIVKHRLHEIDDSHRPGSDIVSSTFEEELITLHRKLAGSYVRLQRKSDCTNPGSALGIAPFCVARKEKRKRNTQT